MTQIGRALNPKLRQQILATAFVFFLRYHVKRPFVNRTNPQIEVGLVAATCVYLAAKVEEHPFHIKSIVQAAQQAMGSNYPIDTTRISECEFHLMEALDFYMIVYHPYQSVVLYFKDLGLPKGTDTPFLQTAWMLVNDTYRSDLPLLYPPHMIALGVIYLTAAMQERSVEVDIGAWFAKLNVEMNDVLIIVQRLLDLYQSMTLYNRERTIELLTRLRQMQQ
ncbi:C/H/G cyclin [Rhizoclosmatium globosum]|uniref:C/H/G cyclin n=1 Tax=Rhizoclosmatium globosum TaxID=329046 RepID=A0A1Y2BS90_9FUNG|nr:C/H/G cyclin [Rhizoclosmatium globosum]|eukprot:ORY37603.1 C/H/G cyclin [Rhizoclosmatium globosum]